MSVTDTPPYTERLHALDAVRGGALLLGIVLHACLSFIPGEGNWLIKDVSRSEGLLVSFYVIHMFRMAIFFLLAGFFGRMVFHRMGAGAFIASRAKRVGLTFVIFWPILFALIVAVTIWGAGKTYGWENLADLPQPQPDPSIRFPFPLTHLWFLYVLMLFYAAIIVLRAPVALIDRGGALRRLADGVLGFFLRFHLLPILMAIPLAAAFMAQDYWIVWTGIPTPDQSLIPNLTAATAYGLAFAVGWVLQRQVGLLSVWKTWSPLYVIAAAGISAACYILAGRIQAASGGFATETPESYAYTCLYALGVWVWVFGLTGLALRFLDRKSKSVRYLAESSYWLYLIHLPLVVGLQVLVSDWPLPALAKFALVLAVSIPLMLVSYHVMVRTTIIGSLLNGSKRTQQHRQERAARKGRS